MHSATYRRETRAGGSPLARECYVLATRNMTELVMTELVMAELVMAELVVMIKQT
jgi:hypothetical protein